MKKTTRHSAKKVRKPAPAKVHSGNTSAASGGPFHDILVPIDFSEHSKNSLRYAVALAQQSGATIHMVYVVEPTVYPADFGFGPVALPDLENELRKKGKVELQALVEDEVGGRVQAYWEVRTGNPHREILLEAERKNVDLIIVATHGHSAVEQMFFGSTAERIVRHAKCPVLTVRPG